MKTLLICTLLFAGLVASAAAVTDKLSLLQQENRSLQQQVKRLEAQVSAMREELNSPSAEQIVSGLGYIAGVFGIAAWVAANRKLRGQK